MLKGWGERIANHFAPRTPQAPNAVEQALEALGTGHLGEALARCEREASQGTPSDEALDALLTQFTRVDAGWYQVAPLTVHDGHRREVNALLRDAAKILGAHGRLK